MAKATRVLSTPPTNTSQSRRAFLAGVATLPIVTALPVAAPAMTSTSTGDAELLGLVEQFIAAETEYCRLNLIWDEMPVSRAKPPAILKIREGDSDLGIPQPGSPSEPEFYCENDVERMRQPKWRDKAGSSFVEDEDVVAVTIRNFTPSPAARARADEIVAAYDKSANRKSRAYRAAERAKDKACEISDNLRNQITEIQATSIQGLIAKVRCVEFGEDHFTKSIIDDLRALNLRPRRGKAVQACG